jgi:hypothetical protein
MECLQQHPPPFKVPGTARISITGLRPQGRFIISPGTYSTLHLLGIPAFRLLVILILMIRGGFNDEVSFV